MSARRTRRGRSNKYIKVQDIEDTIYDSDEDSSNEILPERDRSQAEKDTKNSEKKSDRFNDSVNPCYGKSPDKLKNTSSDIKEKNSLSSDLNKSSTEHFFKKETKDSDSTTQTGGKEQVLKGSESPSEELIICETEDLTTSGRKRNSLLQGTANTFSKRVKTEVNKKMSDPPVHKPLEIELMLERNREPFKRRNINTIIEELDTISRKLKEGYEKCKSPVYWGTPIVKQSSEKWDPNYIPEKLLQLYEKRFDPGQPCSSSSLSESVSESQSEYKPSESKATRTCPEGVDEEAFEVTEYDNLDEPGVDDSYNSNVSGRMTLRNRGPNRPNYDERILGDNLGIEKHSRKGSSKSNKDKKSTNSKKRVISELERSHDPHSQYLDEDSMDPNASFEKLKLDDSGPSTSSMTAVKTHMEEKAISLPSRIVEEEQVACPICGKNFEKKKIESHANHCATETFRD